MFRNAKAFASFSTDTLARAKDFYSNTLGVEVKEIEKMGIIELHLAGGLRVMIYPKHDHKPATYTVLNFIVEDIEKTVDELVAKGIRFEQYDLGQGFKTNEKGIMKNPDEGSIAWFKDPAGNILSIIQNP